MTFGEKLRESRIALKLTQKQLADRIGAKHNSVSDWENNKNKPDPDTIELLCGVLNITPNYLLNTNSADFSISEKEIIRKFRELDSHGKEIVNFILDKEYEKKCQVKNYLISKGSSLIHSLRDNLTIDEIPLWKLDDDTHMIVEYLLDGHDFSLFSETDAIDFCQRFILPMALNSIKLINSFQKDIQIQCAYLVQNMTSNIYNIINTKTSIIYPFDLGFVQDTIKEQNHYYFEKDTLEFENDENIRE